MKIQPHFLNRGGIAEWRGTYFFAYVCGGSSGHVHGYGAGRGARGRGLADDN